MGAAALSLAREYQPDAITLDIFLPDIEGWRVLDRLKNDILTRHIPVCVISTDESRERALNSGALAFVAKPIQSKDTLDLVLDHLIDFVSRPERRVLVVGPEDEKRDSIISCIEADDVLVTAAADGHEALSALEGQQFDCIVLDPATPDLDPSDLAQELDRQSVIRPTPVFVYDEDATDDDDGQWRELSAVATVRRIQSRDRLLDQSMLMLHRNVDKLSESKRQLLSDLHQSDKLLAGKTVLIVDDDMRNIFALTAVLEDHDMVIASADNGRSAIQLLQDQPDIDIVLMDIMMPEMDGIDTMREIRKLSQFRHLPIIAVTAKAMKGDREKCIAAGAWDYLAKPVDTDQLLAVLRAWLHR